MRNFRKISVFLLGIFLFMALSVPARAETVEERKSAVNYSESYPDEGAVQPVEEAPQVPAAPAALPVVQAPEAVSAATEAPEAVTKDLPGEESLGESAPSGIIEVSGYKYPVYLFVPKDYRTDRTYAMVMLAPSESSKAEQQIEYLSGLAQRRSIFILAPYVLWPKTGTTPYTLDQWLLTVKKDVMERYPISPKRVYLVGKDSGAHYAAYMGVKYPKEFAAVALLGQAWDGQFSQLVVPDAEATDQLPFFVALKAGTDAKARNQVWLDKLQQKGYPLHLVDYQADEELTQLEFKKTVFEWLEATSQSWAATQAQGQKHWKAKLKKGVKDFFTD
jgi:pimeloyl-ACP methyl ester carboxylesterase